MSKINLYNWVCNTDKPQNAVGFLMREFREINKIFGTKEFDLGCVTFIHHITVIPNYRSLGNILDDLARLIGGIWFNHEGYIYIIPYFEIASHFRNRPEFISANPKE